MPDVVDLLKQDHREVERLFGAFERDRQPSLAEEISRSSSCTPQPRSSSSTPRCANT